MCLGELRDSQNTRKIRFHTAKELRMLLWSNASFGVKANCKHIEVEPTIQAQDGRFSLSFASCRQQAVFAWPNNKCLLRCKKCTPACKIAECRLLFLSKVRTYQAKTSCVVVANPRSVHQTQHLAHQTKDRIVHNSEWPVVEWPLDQRTVFFCRAGFWTVTNYQSPLFGELHGHCLRT